MTGGQSGAMADAVVCGGGVIGACTAYFLAQKGVKVTIVEKCEVACGASGKAGGFLALDWCDQSPLGNLARASFNLHQKLAAELGGEQHYGYRRLHTMSVSVVEAKQKSGHSSLPSWVDGPITKARSIGNPKTTAQVHPGLFTNTIVDFSKQKYGVQVMQGEVQQVRVDPAQGKVVGVVVDGNLIATNLVVIALGPWSSRNIKLVSDVTTISALKAHSIVLRPLDEHAITDHALFLNYQTVEGETMDPEIYPRPTGEVYICGMSEQVELPLSASQVEPKKESILKLQQIAATVSSQLAGATLQNEQACFLPLTEDGQPLIGKIPNVEGAYIATGHSCWGILNAPATGASLSELIVEGVSSLVDLSAFDPARFTK